MIKVNQTLVCGLKGSCMQAVLASLFGKKLDETIDVMKFPEDAWIEPFIEWVESNNYKYSGVINAHDQQKETLKALASVFAIDGYLYAAVKSMNFDGETHAVIIDRAGWVVHDPNPDKKWQGINTVTTGELIYWYLFEPKNGFVYKT